MEMLQVEMRGWSATPRMPFIISGSIRGGAICLPVPLYSTLLGLIGCCLGRLVDFEEVRIGFNYKFGEMAKDLEKRNRLKLDAKSGRLMPHPDGKDAYLREFHTLPRLKLWLNRLDWKPFFENPFGTPALGRSQDLLKITNVISVHANHIDEGELSGTLVPFKPGNRLPGQIVQVAEAFRENDVVGSGRISTGSKMFLAIRHDQQVPAQIENLYQTETGEQFYFHDWQ